MKNKSNFALAAVVILLAAALLGVGYFAYNQSKTIEKTKSATAEEKGKSSLEKLKKIFYIEEDDKQPAIATVVDVDKLKKSNEVFYKNIQKDDTLIVYPSRAIIYRESANQIINVAPITGTAGAAATTPVNP
jgi:uncharacterized membrane protein YdfJ with MMPL/SSD domain